ncbi:MAG: hypothetical protein IJI83_04810 [Oscillospiraceae bacterium]|nr:hypothetical protein [Oscillospiraceae bacterium]
MTEKERIKRIAELRAELKELLATPRSDWHAAFEALLRIETYKFENRVHIRTEEEIGIMPPRTDFVLLIEDEQVDLGKEIFKAFRKINILEYKNPNDALNERVLRKACGYANLYIGAAEHEGERSADQVTISIFRAVKNPTMFREMEEKGTIVADEIAGIYHVTGITDLPFQIIITGELEGKEYAAYRALTDKAIKTDVEQIFTDISEEQDDSVKEYYRVLLKLVMEKNPQFIEEIRRDKGMADVLMEIVKDKVEERVNAKEQETLTTSIRNLMRNLSMTAEQAMEALNIPEAQRSIYASLVEKSA